MLHNSRLLVLPLFLAMPSLAQATDSGAPPAQVQFKFDDCYMIHTDATKLQNEIASGQPYALQIPRMSLYQEAGVSFFSDIEREPGAECE